jgi:transglutaminase-like putative cysteine protease
MTQAQATPVSSPTVAFRLPWPAMLCGLLAIAALCAREGSLLSPLPLLAVALLASRFSTRRIEQSGQVWMLRAPLFTAVVLLGMARPFTDTTGLYDPQVICLAGELLAVEMTLQAWRQRPSGGRQGMALILLSGLIMLAAADSTEDRAIWFMAPAYTLCLALALPGYRAQSMQDGVAGLYRRSAAAWVALLLALGLGAATHIAFRVHRDELTEWGMQMLHETPLPTGSHGSLSTTPILGATYGLPGSDERSYRIEGPQNGDLPPHLRVMAFDTYAHRSWLPQENGRAFNSEANRSLPPVRPPSWRVTRLFDNDGLLVAPLETTGFDLKAQDRVRWAQAMGPLKSEAPTPSAYLFSTGPEGWQGLFCAPPDSQERAKLLALPQEMDPRVRDLARQAAGAASTPVDKAKAIAAYLPAHHGYSLSYRPGSGDPISSFLLGNSAAHCEYFASSAVLLLRCLGVPARYVIGYYAHERDPGGQIVVRQRDAHAWAEAWIDGMGWMTVEATPADGRPDRDAPVPWWTRLNEWFSDSIANLRARLGRSGLLLVLVVAGLVSMVIAWRNRPRGNTPGGDRTPTYSTPDEQLAALAVRFERLCRRQGLKLPPNRTWEQALNDQPGSPAAASSPFDFEAAHAFVNAYTAARWGGADAQGIGRLDELLQIMERSTLRRR